MKRIVLATQNKNKLIEMQAIFKHFDIQIINPPSDFDPIEDGKTFFDNSLIKAKAASRLMGLPALADDSGLQIEALGGAPGVHSARWAQTNAERIQKAIDSLKGQDNRNAQFVCCMTLTDSKGELLYTSEGICKGIILKEQKGTNGFGYDPIFFIPELGKTMAELNLDEKNKISHRSIALKQMIEFLNSQRENL
ncbi:MAG: RdgB/HAM1 family non-canonical purine NTP pyrophosphatase [Candidatus Gastranaerophilales bacterium]|nr:RdgB/HAM1 family non-canonical purine NTP pyrophosphatase [Candidatus Gastranaerophilales bacterium]